MVEKTYLVVTGAVRWDISRPTMRTSDGSLISTQVGAYPYEYRLGQLGLVHPKIVNYKSKSGKGALSLRIPSSAQKTLKGPFEERTIEGEPIRALAYDVPDLVERTAGGYLTINLYQSEFERVQGRDLNDVLGGMEKIYKTYDILQRDILLQGRWKDRARKQWKGLEVFSISLDRGIEAVPIEEIPYECARIQISPEELQAEQTFVTSMEASRKSQAEALRELLWPTRRMPSDVLF